MIKKALLFILGVVVGILIAKYATGTPQIDKEQGKRETFEAQKDSLQQIIDSRDFQIEKLKRKTDSLLRKQQKEHLIKIKNIVKKQDDKIHYVNIIDSAYIDILAEGLRDSD